MYDTDVVVQLVRATGKLVNRAVEGHRLRELGGAPLTVAGDKLSDERQWLLSMEPSQTQSSSEIKGKVFQNRSHRGRSARCKRWHTSKRLGPHSGSEKETEKFPGRVSRRDSTAPDSRCHRHRSFPKKSLIIIELVSTKYSTALNFSSNVLPETFLNYDHHEVTSCIAKRTR